MIAYASTILFLKGHLLFASLITFAVSFMDGVDGKLSRVKISSSNNDYYNFLVICEGRILLSKGHETLAYDGS